MDEFLTEARQLMEYTRRMRRDFHRHPELGFQEVRTAGIVAQELNKLGLEVTTGVAHTGVVALLEGSRPGPVILVRFDMDALPIHEETGAEYASQHPGVMHACGHDGHTAIGLTVAQLLQGHADELAGTVKLVFQPAEEGLGGAEGMIAEGVLEEPAPQLALALHLWNEKPLGWFGISPGPVMAASEMFRVRLNGKGGHGALPHLAIDPVLAAAQVISSLQSIAARFVSPLNSAVVSATSIHAGETFNVIPQTVDISGTIRTFEKEVRQDVINRFYEIVTNVANAFGCQAEIDMQLLTPAVINDPEVTEGVRKEAAHLYPRDHIDGLFRTMVSEDMAYMMQGIPGCYFLVGSANPSEGLDAPHHHPKFDIDEEALPRAAALMSSTIARYLR
jgi:amidohydrolase